MPRRELLSILLLTSCLISCARTQGPEQFYFGSYSEAEKLYNKGQYAEAIVQYQEYIEENPEGNLAVISHYYIARSHRAMGNIEDARRIFNEIIANHKDLVWASFSETQLQEIEKAT